MAGKRNHIKRYTENRIRNAGGKVLEELRPGPTVKRAARKKEVSAIKGMKSAASKMPTVKTAVPVPSSSKIAPAEPKKKDIYYKRYFQKGFK